jgi:hypothetical protein
MTAFVGTVYYSPDIHYIRSRDPNVVKMTVGCGISHIMNVGIFKVQNIQTYYNREYYKDFMHTILWVILEHKIIQQSERDMYLSIFLV